ncbi:hypothetical protein E2562_028356 [Oryza meyeriana var. granulata]|uniref:Nuclear condensin complex subunit 3 C-terminal domain-containing protein n=1 Tax=Oryza meyeriana var. granulata TaxID=110450 RepID=A0A6G1CVS5_9ORYZ|nr:hypothetical protein E2562_028356 [Oryza meyeriana var. granulata]
MAPAAAVAVAGAGETRRLEGEVARVLDECRASLAVHPRKLRELAALRSSPSAGGRFLPAFCAALTPLFDPVKRSAAADRVARFAAAFASATASGGGGGDGFLEGFLRFLLAASAAAHRPARLRSCQIISEIIMRLPDDAEVSDEIWDEVIDGMKVRVQDKIPGIRAFAVRALSRFASDGEDSDIVDLFLETLEKEQNAEVRKATILSLPPSNATLETVIESTLDVSESVRRAAYCVLSTKFPLQSLSIKQRTSILHRGLSDRSASVNSECLKMLKDEWLMKYCSGDIITFLRFLDVETYEEVGETVMGVLMKDGSVRVQDGQTIRQYFTANTEVAAEQASNIQLMDAEFALYWKIMCKHLQAEAQIKGSEAATTTGTEAAVYASEASDKNDLLDGVLPCTISDYVDLVKAHLSAGPNYHFASRQLLLLGEMLDFSDTMNRKVASSFLHELLTRPLEHEVDEDGNKMAIGDGVSLGGDKEWAKAVAELAKRVHATVGEFEMVVATVVEELARPCRERTADFMHWMHCLAVTGLLLENASSLRSLQGKAIEPPELLQSLLLPATKQNHVDVQRVALRCLCLFGLLENRPNAELVKQLRLSFINGPDLVSAMASKALVDLVTWHGPQEIDQAIGIESFNATNEKSQFSTVDISNMNDDDLNIGVLDILFSGFLKDDWEFTLEGDNHDNVPTILGEGFAKILLLSDNYAKISADLHPVILARLVSLYFMEETKELERLKQCLSVFFQHYPALSDKHKRCVSSAFVPVMRAMWPGLYGNVGGSAHTVSKKRKYAVQAARFMVQMVQTPLFSTETTEQASTSPESQSTKQDMSNNFDISEEGLAIRIAVEVANCPDKKTAAGKAYCLALCKVVVLLRFQQSEQKAIKCMRGLVNALAASAASDKDLLKELTQMASRLRSLDEHPEEELPQDEAEEIFKKLGLEGGFRLESNSVVPPTPAPRSVRPPPSRRRARRSPSSSDDSDINGQEENLHATSVSRVAATPMMTGARSQRASKTAAMSKMSAKPTVASSDDQSGVTSDEDSSDEESS